MAMERGSSMAMEGESSSGHERGSSMAMKKAAGKRIQRKKRKGREVNPASPLEGGKLPGRPDRMPSRAFTVAASSEGARGVLGARQLALAQGWAEPRGVPLARES